MSIFIAKGVHNMRFFVSLTLLLTLIATPLFADSIDIGFNEDSFQAGLESSLRNTSYGNTAANIRILHNDDKETKLVSAGFDFLGKPGNMMGLTTGLGVKGYLGSTDHDLDFANVALGVRAEYTIPQLLGLGVEASIYFAPKVLSFRDSEKLLDSQIRLTFPIIPKAKVFVGYQNIMHDFDNSGDDESIDEGLRFGFIGTF
jgi:hypothetical protein